MRKGPKRKKKTREAREAAHLMRVKREEGKKKLQKPRQPVTPFALGHHLGKSGILKADFDSRQGHLVKYPASALMAVLMMGMLTATTSMRKIETLTTTFSTTIRRMFGVTSRRIADTTLYDFLCRLELNDLNGLLARYVKSMWRLGRLMPQGVPFSVAAFDGKYAVHVKFERLMKLLEVAMGAPVPAGTPGEILRGYVRAHLPSLQLTFPKKKGEDGRVPNPYALLRSHRMTLVSHKAAPCMANEVIPGMGNEVGHAPGFLKQVLGEYRHTKLAEMVTADAGNCSREIVETIRAMGSHFLLAIKANQPEALALAHQMLGKGDAALREPDYSYSEIVYENEEEKRYERVRREVWVVDAPGLLQNLPFVEQLIRVRRTIFRQEDGAQVYQGNRFFISSMKKERLTPKYAAAVVRMYWRCENLGHWVSVVIWREDAPHPPLTRKLELIPVMMLLRLLAQSIVGVLRSMTRRGYDEHHETAYDEVIENVKRALNGSVRSRHMVEVLAGR